MGEEFHIRRTVYQKIQEIIKNKMETNSSNAFKPEEICHEAPTKNDVYDIEIWNALYGLYEKAFKSGYAKCKEDIKESLSYLKGD